MLAAVGAIAPASFIAGAAIFGPVDQLGSPQHRQKQYAYPITFEALLLLAFGVLGVSAGAAPQVLSLALPLLCFLMSLQNATITKLSGARIRTTHLTGYGHGHRH